MENAFSYVIIALSSFPLLNNDFVAAYTTFSIIHINASLVIGLVTGVMTFLILIFGEIIPKVFAHKYALKFSLWVAPVIQFLSWILWPIVTPISFLSKKFAGKNKKTHGLSEDELKAALELSENEGRIEKDEKELVEDEFSLDSFNLKEEDKSEFEKSEKMELQESEEDVLNQISKEIADELKKEDEEVLIPDEEVEEKGVLDKEEIKEVKKILEEDEGAKEDKESKDDNDDNIDIGNDFSSLSEDMLLKALNESEEKESQSSLSSLVESDTAKEAVLKEKEEEKSVKEDEELKEEVQRNVSDALEKVEIIKKVLEDMEINITISFKSKK